MKKKRFLVFFILILVLVAGLTACERSLAPSGSPTETVAAPSGQTTSEATEDVMQQIWLLATQTAMAQQGETVVQETAVPTESSGAPAATEVPTEVPTAVPTQAPSPTMATVPTSTPGIPRTYTLHKGEFPFCIARRFNVNQYELLNASGLSLNSIPSTGYVLTIPQTGHPFDGNRALRPHPATHTVVAGESIYSIACLYGDVSPEAIAAANGLQAPYNLTAGQTLQIP